MANRKRKSTAAKQRAKARQQQRAAAAARTEQTQVPEQAPQPGVTRSPKQGGTQTTPEQAPRSAVTQTPKQVPKPSGGQPARRPGDRPPRSMQRRRSRRVPWVLIGGVVVFVGFLVVMFLTRADDTSRGDASEGSIEKLTSVPVETLDAVGVPAQPSNVNPLPAGTPAVEEGGKPTVTYIGAEYCPFCAVERWPMVVALSQFGTFEGLESTTSAPPPETLPNTPTVTFAGSTYTSDIITFSSAETETRDFQPLEELTPTQQELVDTYNVEAVTGSNGGIPFVMIGNLYAWAGSQYDTGVLEGKDFDQIVTELQDPTTDVAKEIGGAANYITAMICQLTDNQPEDVCSREVIQQAQAALPTA